jgi:hypothetical protein
MPQHPNSCVTHGDFKNVIPAIYKELLSFPLRLYFMSLFQLDYLYRDMYDLIIHTRPSSSSIIWRNIRSIASVCLCVIFKNLVATYKLTASCKAQKHNPEISLIQKAHVIFILVETVLKPLQSYHWVTTLAVISIRPRINALAFSSPYTQHIKNMPTHPCQQS